MGSNTKTRGEPSNDPQREILDAIRRILRAVRVSSRLAERDFGISGAQLLILQTLERSGELTINELADQTHTHQSSVSTVVTRLESVGLAQKSRSTDDARRTVVALTAKGRRIAKSNPGLAQERLISAVDQLSTSDRKDLARVLTELVRMAGFDQEPATLFFEDERGTDK